MNTAVEADGAAHTLESLDGHQNDLAGSAAVTCCPLKLPLLRLTAEMVQRKEDRAFTLLARGQF